MCEGVGGGGGGEMKHFFGVFFCFSGSGSQAESIVGYPTRVLFGMTLSSPFLFLRFLTDMFH